MNTKYSGPARRLFAFMIDCLVILGGYMAIGLAFGLNALHQPLLGLPMVGIWYYAGMGLFTWLYFSLMESSDWQATLGKKTLNLKVTSKDGARISFLRASMRHISEILVRPLICINFLMILFTKKKQALHDKIASTLVVIQQ